MVNYLYDIELQPSRRAAYSESSSGQFHINEDIVTKYG
jgi:hypothetical protein